MAFEIKVKSEIETFRVRMAIWNNIQASRFQVADLGERQPKRKERSAGVRFVLTIHEIRLKKSKFYCGSHPAACEAKEEPRKRPFGGKALFLEGADWIGFNDLVNDALDGLGVDADVETPVCEVRRGRCRRIRYGYHEEVKTYKDFRGTQEKRFNEWDKVGGPDDYADHCGQPAPTTAFPEGTPGEAKWRAETDASVSA